MTFNATTYHEVFQAADKIYLSTKITDVSAGVAAINDLSGSAAGATAEVSAVKKPSRGGKPFRGGRGGGRGGKKPQSPSNLCDNHKKWQSDAWFCLEPLTCPMVSKVSAKPSPTPKPTKENK